MNGKKKIFVILAFLILSFVLIIYGASRSQGKVTVTFIDGYNDKVIDKQIIMPGEDAEVPGAPKHDSFVFEGWYKYGSTNTLISDFKNIEKDLKAEARYKADKNKNGIADDVDTYYTVRFIDGVTGGLLKTESVLVGMGATAPIASTHENYTFTGWNKEYSNIQSNVDITSVYTRQNNENNITPVVVNPKSYTLKFYDKSNEVFTTQTIEENNIGGSVETPVYEGYSFKGWFLENGEEYIIGNRVTSNLDIYGKWELNKYEVKINMNGGTTEDEIIVDETQILDYGTEFNLPSATKNYKLTYHAKGARISGKSTVVVPAKFLGWCLGSNTCSEEELINPNTKITVKENAEYFAIWGQSNKSIKITTAAKNSSASTDYTFTGWKTEDGEKTYSYKEYIYLNSDLDLYAAWNEVIRKFDVVLLGNIDEENNPSNLTTEQKVLYDTKITLPNSKKSFTLTYNANGGILGSGESTMQVDAEVAFKGWCKNICFGPYLNAGSEVTITNNTLFTAIHSIYSESKTLIGASKEADENYTYEFEGWSLYKNAKFADSRFDEGKEIKLISNTTLYAVYNKKPIPSYKITFNPNGGNMEVTEYSRRVNTIINESELPVPARTYTVTYEVNNGTAISPSYLEAEFSGWCEGTTGDCATPVTSITVTGDKTYTAKWASKNFTLPEARRDATAEFTYSFSGWSTANDDIAEYTSTIDVIDNTTLYAVWGKTTNKYNITFVDYDNTILKTEEVEYGKGATAPEDPTREASVSTIYTFAGWDKEFNAITGDLTVTAQYSEAVRNYTVTFKSYDSAVLSTQTIPYGTSATAPTVPTRTNWSFVGWDKEFTYIQSNLEVTTLFVPNLIRIELSLAVNAQLEYRLNSTPNVKDQLVVTKFFADNTTSVAIQSEYGINNFNTISIGNRSLTASIGSITSNSLNYRIIQEEAYNTKFEVKLNETGRYNTKNRYCFFGCWEENGTQNTNYKFLEVIEHYNENISLTSIRANYTDGTSENLQYGETVNYAYYKNDAYYSPVRIVRRNNNKDVMTDSLIINTLEIIYNRNGYGRFKIVFSYDSITKRFIAIDETAI